MWETHAVLLEDGRVRKEMRRRGQQRFVRGTSEELQKSFVLSPPCTVGPELPEKMSMVTICWHKDDVFLLVSSKWWRVSNFPNQHVASCTAHPCVQRVSSVFWKHLRIESTFAGRQILQVHICRQLDTARFTPRLQKRVRAMSGGFFLEFVLRYRCNAHGCLPSVWVRAAKQVALSVWSAPLKKHTHTHSH